MGIGVRVGLAFVLAFGVMSLNGCSSCSEESPAPDLEELADVVETSTVDVPLVDGPPDQPPPPEDAEVEDQGLELPPAVEIADQPEVEIPEITEEPSSPECVEDCGPGLCDDQSPCISDEECQELLPPEDCCMASECQWDLVCGGNMCQLVPVPNCCLDDADCDDGNLCTEDSCEECQCANVPISPVPAECVEEVVVLDLNFDDCAVPPAEVIGPVNPYPPGGEVAWYVIPGHCAPGCSLYMGDPDTMTYNNGGQVEAEFFIHELNLPENAYIALTFDIWLDTEPSIPGSVQFDILKAFVLSVDGEIIEVYNTVYLDGTTDGLCVPVALDLSAWAGQSIDIWFQFDSLDGTENDGEGIYLDNVKVATYDADCESDFQCDDDDSCTEDWCQPLQNFSIGICQHEPEFEHCTTCLLDEECQDLGPFPDDPECWIPTCVEMPNLSDDEMFCTWPVSIAPDCCDPALMALHYEEGFEEGEAAFDEWEVVPSFPVAAWQLAEQGCEDPADPDPWAAVFEDCGVPLCEGSFTSPFIDLTAVPQPAALKLTFCLFMSTEWDDVPEDAYVSLGIDTLYLDVIPFGGEAETVWSSDQVFGSTNGDYTTQAVDLTPFAGQKIKLRFFFTTADVIPANNDGLFVVVDELHLESTCDPICNLPEDCTDPYTCMAPVCVEHACSYVEIAGCCSPEDLDCDDGDICTVDTCDVVIGECWHEFTGDPSCCNPTASVYETGFEEGGQWVVTGSDDPDCGNGICGDGESCLTCPADCNLCPVAWHILDGDQCFLGSCLYFGNLLEGNYDNGNQPAVGEVVSPAITLPLYGSPKVTFQLRLETEHCMLCQFFAAQSEIDKLSLWVQQDIDPDPDLVIWGGKQPVWDSMAWDFKGCTADDDCDAVWKTVEVGLSQLDLAGQTVRFTFEFDSADGFANDFAGVFVDDFEVSTHCDDVECFSGFECSECSPEVPHCTLELCEFPECKCEANPLALGLCCLQDTIAEFDWDGPCDMEGWQPWLFAAWDVSSAENNTEGGECSMHHPNELGGRVVSPEIDVSGLDEVQVSFWAWIDVGDPIEFAGLDELRLAVDQVILPGLPPQEFDVPIWHPPCPAEAPQCQEDPVLAPCLEWGCDPSFEMAAWRYYSVIVPVATIFEPFGGWPAEQHTVIFEFEFTSLDPFWNDGAGIFIDDLKVQTSCL